MSQADYTHISMVLDRSGSMSSCKNATIEGVNKFVTEQKALPGQATATIVQFDHEYQALHSGKALKDIPLLTDTSYEPRGSTALYDSVARCIRETGEWLAAMPEVARPKNVLFLIVTDGYENASTDFSVATGGRAKLKAMIEHQTKVYGWAFAYIGANQDAMLNAQDIGILHSNALNYSATPTGTSKAFDGAIRATAMYRSSGGATGQSIFQGETHAGE